MATSGTTTALTLTYTLGDDSTAVLAATEYRIDRNSTPGVVRQLREGTWPANLDDQNAITVTWWAGYGSSGSSVPAAIRSAMLMLVAHLWRNREMTTEAALSEVPMGTKALLDSARWGSYR
jgi:uncharacterized phiE125 gp8 family phage protein